MARCSALPGCTRLASGAPLAAAAAPAACPSRPLTPAGAGARGGALAWSTAPPPGRPQASSSAAVTASFPESRRGGWLRSSAAGCCTCAAPGRAGGCAAGAPRRRGSPRAPRAYSCRQPPKSAAALIARRTRFSSTMHANSACQTPWHHSIARILSSMPEHVRQSKAGRGSPGEEPRPGGCSAFSLADVRSAAASSSATHSPTTSLPQTAWQYSEGTAHTAVLAALLEQPNSGRRSAPHWARAAALQRPAREAPRCPPGAPSRDLRMLEQGPGPLHPRPHALPRPPRPPPLPRRPCGAPGARPRLQPLLPPGAPSPRAQRPLARLAQRRWAGAARRAHALR